MALSKARHRQLSTFGVGCFAVVAAVSISLMADPAQVAVHAGDEEQGPPTAAGAPAKEPRRPPPLRFMRSGDGFLVVKPPRVRERDRVDQGNSGTTTRYSVEVEPGLKSQARRLSRLTDQVLNDGKRGWESYGGYRFKRVAEAGLANIRVVLARPETVDARCATVGLLTNGLFSCWDGARAMINLNRWLEGASDFESLQVYRRYVINHEVGHGLGYGHQPCTLAGAHAPVMMQQTKSTGSCRPNEWPNPQ